MFQVNVKGTLKKNLDYCNQKKATAEKIVDAMKSFSFTAFEKQFVNRKQNSYTLQEAFATYYNSFKKKGRIQSSNLYKNTLNALLRYKATVDFNHITVKFLEDFEKHNVTLGNSITTVKIYVVCLRTIINKAITDKVIQSEVYPFGKNKYVIPEGKNIKKALKKDQLKTLFEYQPKKENEKEAKEYWLFSYLANGMNLKILLG